MTAGGAPAVVILAHADDHGAEAVASALATRRGEASVWRVTPADLSRATSWTHTVAPSGHAGGELVLASGRRLVADGIGCVLNRLHAVVPAGFARADVRERDYAAAEIQALVVSWLAGLGRPVIHAAGGVGPVAGASRRQWLAQAVRAGIPVARTVTATSPRLLRPDLGMVPVIVGPWPGSPAVPGQPVEARELPDPPLQAVLVAGDRVHGPVATELTGPCVALAERSGCALLGLTFGSFAGRSRLVDVDPCPPLLDTGSVSAAAALLERASEART